MAVKPSTKGKAVRIYKDGKCVILECKIRANGVERDYPFQFECPDMWVAELLVDHVREQVMKAVKTAQWEAYHIGRYDSDRGRKLGRSLYTWSGTLKAIEPL